MKKLIPLLILFSFLLAGCGGKNPPPAKFDVTGTWTFRMSKLYEQETTYDTGVITFTGTPDRGEFTLISQNGLDISGNYIVSGIAFSFETNEDFIIQGSFPSEDELFGSWEVSKYEGGLWTADRQ